MVGSSRGQQTLGIISARRCADYPESAEPSLVALWLEGLDAENPEPIAAERERQARASIQAITLPEAEARRFVALATEVAWRDVIRRSPETGPRLRRLIAD